MKKERDLGEGLYFVHGYYPAWGELRNDGKIARNQMILLKDNIEDIYAIDAYDVNLDEMRLPQRPFAQGEFVYVDDKGDIQSAESHPTSIMYTELNRLLINSLGYENYGNQATEVENLVSDVHSYHINVGHGNCSIIVFSNGENYEMWMIDCSVFDFTNKKHYGSNLDECMKDISNKFRITRLTKLLITHLHYDHINGIEYLKKKEDMFLSGENRYTAQQSNFAKIPGSPVAYWVSTKALSNFSNMSKVGDFGVGRIGLITGDTNRFIRFWYETDVTNIGFVVDSNEASIASKKRWFPIQNGGDFRKWYGNIDSVVDWENDGYRMKFDNYSGSRVRSHNYNGDFAFKRAISWTTISSSHFSCRYADKGFIFDTAGPFFAPNDNNDIWELLAYLQSKVADYYLRLLNPTINFPPGYIQALPYCRDCNSSHISEISKESVSLSKTDWDAFETSWGFIRHPLAPAAQNKQEQENSQFVSSRMEKFGWIAWHYDNWANECAERFVQLKSNEEELNRIFINIYGLQDELTPEVEDKDVTVRLADKARDIRSFISYAVGCMFGRYSLDVDGLAYAGGEWDASKYSTYIPDKDAILPICDDEYFEDDIANRFVDFVRVVYGKDTLEENLKFIADALGGKGAPRQVIRDYFMNDFYADHLKVYQKRPIYWLFDSGRKDGFKCLIYIHRYKPDTIARIRTDYVHEQQARYRTAIAGLENQIANAGTGERVKLNKQLKKLQDQADELHGYEEKIHHLADQFISIDLDDGVKHNYEIFNDVLARIK